MRAALIVALLLLIPAGSSHAHVRSSAGYGDVRADGGRVHYELSLETEVLDAAAGDETPEAYVLPLVRVFLDGVECEGAVERAGTASHDGRDHTRFLLDYECHGSADGVYEIRYGVFADGAVVDDHTNVTRYELAGNAGSFVFDAGHRELVAGDTTLVASGAVVWSVLVPGRPYLGGVLSPPAVSGDTVYVGANNGHLYALDRARGTEQWRFEIGTWVASGPAISGNALLAGAWDGNLYAFAEN